MDGTERLLASDAWIAVAGAGSVGCFIGGLLAHAGRRVIFLARPHMVEEVTAHGLHLTDFAKLDRRLTSASLTVTDDPAALETAALILVAVKSGATKAMAHEMVTHGDRHAVVVSLQNGVDNLPALRAALPEMQVLGGIVGFNVVHMGEGRFHRGTSGKLVIEAGRDDVVSLLSAPGLDIGTADDIAGAQWGKLLLNLNNALNALSDLPLRQQLQNREWRRLAADQITEALAVLKAAGIRPIAATPAPNRLLPAVLRLPDALFRLGAGRMLAIDPEPRSSMWDDLMRRRPTEIGHLQAAILQLAERHGVEAPLCARVAALVRQAEAAEAGPPGLTPEQVRGQTG